MVFNCQLLILIENILLDDLQDSASGVLVDAIPTRKWSLVYPTEMFILRMNYFVCFTICIVPSVL